MPANVIISVTNSALHGIINCSQSHGVYLGIGYHKTFIRISNLFLVIRSLHLFSSSRCCSPSPSLPSPSILPSSGSLAMTFSNCDHRASTEENSFPTVITASSDLFSLFMFARTCSKLMAISPMSASLCCSNGVFSRPPAADNERWCMDIMIESREP